MSQPSSSSYQWRVLISRTILNDSPGPIWGNVDFKAKFICCLEVQSQSDSILQLTREIDSDHDPLHQHDLFKVVGYWHGMKQVSHSEDDNDTYDLNYDYLARLYGDVSGKQIVICSSTSRLSTSNDDEIEINPSRNPAVCILFSQSSIMNSFLFLNCSTLQSDRIQQLPSSCQDDFKLTQTCSKKISKIIENFHNRNCMKHPVHPTIVKTRVLNAASTLICLFPSLSIMFLSFIYLTTNTSISLLRKTLYLPSFNKHLLNRGKRNHQILQLSDDVLFNKLIKYNAYAQHLLESFLGILLLYYFMTNDLDDQAATSFLDWADDVAKQSNDLIKWLMGAPAGLKLNSQLTGMLGHFFIYHIYLWTGYLRVLRTVLPWLLLFGSWMGVFGISFQLCILKDIISMLTLHIYCFYVYAARIFNLQVAGLASLWRLFRGKKWNVLRHRVDSAAYNADQLFVGTLIFTVLLFLLPTIGLYYAVFTGLRIVVLFVQGLLSFVINCINIVPVYSILIRIFKPSWITGNVEFEIIHPGIPPDNLVLEMKTSHVPLSELLNLTTPYFKTTPSLSYSWSQFLSCIATGQILYPWLEDMSEDKAENPLLTRPKVE